MKCHYLLLCAPRFYPRYVPDFEVSSIAAPKNQMPHPCSSWKIKIAFATKGALVLDGTVDAIDEAVGGGEPTSGIVDPAVDHVDLSRHDPVRVNVHCAGWVATSYENSDCNSGDNQE